MLRTYVARPMARGRLIKSVAHCVCLGMAAASGAALAEIAQSPLFLPVPPPPNIMYISDNSGSMVWGSATGKDALYEDTAPRQGTNAVKNTRSYYASAWNQIYYNPATTYTPAVKADGTSMGNASIVQTIIDPYLTPNNKLGNISATCYPGSSLTLPLYNATSFAINSNCSNTNNNRTPLARYAFYYDWVGAGDPIAGNSINYVRVDILPTRATYPRAATRTDCTAADCTYAEEIQNFANWFSYYRTRDTMTKTAMGRVFKDINERFRVGFATINDNTRPNGQNNIRGHNFVRVADFNDNQKRVWYQKLYEVEPNGGTPLIHALDRVGQYYMGNGMEGAVKDDPIQLKCQANFTILATDGYWNGSKPNIGEYDRTVSTAMPVPTIADPVSGTVLERGKQFPRPFYDGSTSGTATSNTLADVAMKYWIADVGERPGNGGTVGKIAATSTDPATWQHMTTYTIGLGPDGDRKYQEDYKTALSGDYFDIKNGTKDWPVPEADKASALDDLWHAAVNGHGSYFSVKSPQQLQSSLKSILDEIGRSTGSGGGFAYPGGPVSAGTLGYTPSFESGSWIGHLNAYKMKADGTFETTPVWDAATLLPAHASRNIVTWNPASKAAVRFDWANLSSGVDSQQAFLGSADVVAYLRGDAAKEQAADGSGAGIYRYRQNKLGSIVNSSPVYAARSDFGYARPAVSGGDTYQAFVASKAARDPMLYVGANDGMLHGFDAKTGVEKFAFIPNSVYPKLKWLSDPDYTKRGHLYFVDGPLAEGDAYFANESAWKNILVGSTGAGAKSVFAVDVTIPGSLGANSVLWENDAGSDNDLGHVLGAPAVVRLANDQWAAVFGNGYESVNGRAVLYLVDIQTGALIRKIDTGVGSAAAPNGLSAPALLFNASRQLIAAYSGDLQGNLWKFDLENPSPVQWSRSSLFQAKGTASNAQPIVQTPVIAPHPRGGYLVMFGSGKYFETTDRGNTDPQSLYGIWDKPGASSVTGRSELQQQTLTNVVVGGELIGRTLSKNAIAWTTKRGWYIDYYPDSGERTNGGLRVLKDVVLLTTSYTPNVSDPCAGGGSSQVLGVNFLTGGYSDKFQLIVPGVPPGTNLSSATVPGTIGGATPVPNPNASQPGCILTVGSDGKIHCLNYKTPGTAVRYWRQLSTKPN